MSALLGVREQRAQFFYDTDFLAIGTVTTGADLAQAEKNLFAAAVPGNFARTNLQTAGQLTSDQTFVCYAVRHEVNFWGGVSSGATPAAMNVTSGVSIATINNSTFAFAVGDKVMFQGPIAMTPAGGGPWGVIQDSNQPLIVNGEPQAQGVFPLMIAIGVQARAGISMIERKHNVTVGSNATLDVSALINNYTGLRIFRAYIDGAHTRDVQ